MATKTTTKKSAPKGPKQGSARSNQMSAPVKSANTDTITAVIPARTGNGVIVQAGTNNLVIAPWQDKGTTRKLAVVGGSLKAVRDHIATIEKPKAKLARGVDSHNSPQSAKAVADQAKTAPKATNKGKSRAEKAAKTKQPARGTNRKYKLAGRKDESKPGTFRTYMLTTIMTHKDTDSAKAAHAKSRQYPNHKLDFNWTAQQGYIAFVD